MDFLAPLFLAGAAAVALPILFHLIRKTTNEKTIFSSLMFLFPTPPKVTRRSRLDNILLLLLRCAVLCLLAAGFARPFLTRPSAAEPPAGGGKKVVVLVDTSASMRRENLWAQARERVNDVLQRLGPADEAALFTFDDRSSQLVSLDEWRRAQPAGRKAMAMARLEAMAPTWRGTHLGNALLGAVDGLQEVAAGATESRPTEIVIISDLQEGSRLDGLQGFEWPKGLNVGVETLKARRTGNAGVQLVGEREDVGPAAEVNQRVRVVNASNSRREQFKLAWAGGTNAPIETYVPAGQSRILQLPPNTQRSGELVLTGDEEDFDNRVYWVGTRQARVEVAYLGPEAETDTTQPLFYLKRAFQQTARQDVQITNRVSADTALCVVGGESADSRPQLRGGVVLVVMKTPAAARVVSELVGVPGLSCEEAAGQKYSLLAEIDFTHPLFKPFADPRFSDFTKIHFWKHRKLDAEQIPGARVLARFDNGNPALLEVPRTEGRSYGVLILTSGWHPADSQLALSSKFVPLLYSLLEASATTTPERVQYEVGEKSPDVPGIHSESNTLFAVNLPAAESKTAPMAIDELEQLGVPVKMSSAKVLAEQKLSAQKFQAAEAENQQKLWRWLILGALGFVVVETFMAGRLSKSQ